MPREARERKAKGKRDGACKQRNARPMQQKSGRGTTGHSGFPRESRVAAAARLGPRLKWWRSVRTAVVRYDTMKVPKWSSVRYDPSATVVSKMELQRFCGAGREIKRRRCDTRQCYVLDCSVASGSF